MTATDGVLAIFCLTEGNRHKRSANANCEPRFTVIENHSACLNRSDQAGASGVSEAEKKEIVDVHNLLRSQVDPPARDMMKMSWDDDVALVAQKWAENCVLNHDGNYQRRIPGRFSSGQNLAWGGGRMTWNTTVYLWHSEVSKFTFGGPNTAEIGHYTQVVWSSSIKVGCGYAYCQTNAVHYYVCNYSPAGNSNRDLPYKNGTSCGDCQSRCENNLCDCGGIICENDGVLDLNTCTCRCSLNRPYYVGNNCAMNCSLLIPDISWCTDSLTTASCAQFSNVPYYCPNLCSICNYTLNSVAEITSNSPLSSSSTSASATTGSMTSSKTPMMTTTGLLTSSKPSRSSSAAAMTTSGQINLVRTTEGSSSTNNGARQINPFSICGIFGVLLQFLVVI
ncbi:cysteine-rich venom protein Mr30-like [Saccostrea echinata]|uniref:cysteine-rich venom protein Mr30-like n=1 Tax=Saccostrea echinata TaxID=191078 RepID=UPI002A818D9D|nr:cysteine-rich venom protein Mr30-like [Saccostrea echinata]